jgi:2-oxoglutarate dehydrogenase E2 component (dihydrolipoamide succinyltransferase)
MHALTLPKLNNNDVVCRLLEWRAASGDTVAPHAVVALLETSKASFELEPEQGGVLEIVEEAGRDYPFGTVIGYVFESETARVEFREAARRASRPPVAAGGLDISITRDARSLMLERNVSQEQVTALGKRVIRRADVEALVAATSAPAPEGGRVLRHQEAVAQAVTLSHATIPKAFVLIRVNVDAVLVALRRAAEEAGMMIGLPELLVQVTAGLAGQFPAFFASSSQEASATQSSNVGVTFDLGKGLFVPVVERAGERTLRELAQLFLGFRIKAMRDAFRPDEMAGGHITVSLNTDRDVVFQLPLVMPGQTAILSLGGVQEELFLGPGAQVAARSCAHLGLAYDHRVINGREAVQFLKSIQASLEQPDGIVGTGRGG